MFVSKRKFTALEVKLGQLTKAVTHHNEALRVQVKINERDDDHINSLRIRIDRALAINERLADTLAIMRSMHSLAADINLTHAEAIDTLFHAVANLEALAYDTPKPVKASVAARSQHPSNVSKKA